MTTNGNGRDLAVRDTSNTAVARARSADLVWSGDLTPPQQAAVRLVCEKFQLEPVLNHVYVLGGKLYISLEGWLEIAGRHPQYDGYEFRVLTRDEKDAMLAGDDDVMFEAKVYRKDRSRPAMAYGRANRNNVAAESRLRGQERGTGQKLVIEVAQARALRKALRNAFRATELVLPDDDDAESDVAPERDYLPFWQAVEALGVSHDEAHQILGVASVKDVADLRAAYKRIKAHVQARTVQLRATPLSRDEFITAATAPGMGLFDKAGIAAVLGVKQLDDWERDGGTWEQALARIATEIEKAAEAARAEPEVIEVRGDELELVRDDDADYGDQGEHGDEPAADDDERAGARLDWELQAATAKALGVMVGRRPGDDATAEEIRQATAALGARIGAKQRTP